MDRFWDYLFNEKGYSCDNFNRLMFDKCNNLQPVYNTLPGDDHWDFIGITQELNKFKAMVRWSFPVFNNSADTIRW